MSEKDLGETQPQGTDEPGDLTALESTQASRPGTEPETPSEDPLADTQSLKKRPRRWRWALAALGGLLLFVGLGALVGAQSGISARQNKARLDRAVEAVAQFELGQADLQAGKCDIARQRFEYVIQLDPSYPGAAVRLAESMLCAGTAPQEILVEATPVLTPTPDLRDAEDIFTQSQALFVAKNWDELLQNLDTLRKNFPDIHPIEVDDMYYIALRNRGVSRILANGELERGIFDLNRAEQIGPLDVEANQYRDWAILYIVGQSFWEVDWAQAVQYFSQIAAVAPNLYDVNFFTAQDRLATAQVGYAEELVKLALFYAGAKGWCDANELMRTADSYSPHSPELKPTASWITEKCELNPDEEPRVTPAQ